MTVNTYIDLYRANRGIYNGEISSNRHILHAMKLRTKSREFRGRAIYTFPKPNRKIGAYSSFQGCLWSYGKQSITLLQTRHRSVSWHRRNYQTNRSPKL